MVLKYHSGNQTQWLCPVASKFWNRRSSPLLIRVAPVPSSLPRTLARPYAARKQETGRRVFHVNRLLGALDTAAVMAMRHLQRALRLSSASWSSLELPVALSGSDILGRARSDLQSSPSAPKPAMREFMLAFSSAHSSSRFKSSEPTDVYDYNKLISAIIYKRRPNLVRDVYEDMLLDGVKPSPETFFLLINGCMKSSRLQDVMYFFEEMKAIGYSPDVALYNCVIAACGRSLQVDRAFKVAEEMEASGIQPKHRTFLTLLRSCAVAGRVDEAYGVVRRMAASGLSLDNNFYCALIIAHKNKKPPTEEAIKKIFELLEQSKQQSAEDLMAVAATGDSEEADYVDDGLGNLLSDDMQPRRGFLNRRLAVYHAAVKSLTELGNKEAVKTVLKLVEMDGQEPDSYCVIQLIKCYLAEKDFEQACAEFSKYVDTGRLPTLELYMLMIEGALVIYSPESSAVAQRLLVDLAQKGYFLNAQLGSQLLQRACLEKTRDMAVANIIWDMMKNREVKISKFIAQEYYRALERSKVPKDDPRLLAVKALVDEGRRVDFRVRADSTPAAQSEQVPGHMAPLEQVTAQMASSEQVAEGPVVLNLEPHGDVAVDKESPIETDSSFDLSPELVEQQEKVQ